jgi:hypothetical protein
MVTGEVSQSLEGAVNRKFYPETHFHPLRLWQITPLAANAARILSVGGLAPTTNGAAPTYRTERQVSDELHAVRAAQLFSVPTSAPGPDCVKTGTSLAPSSLCIGH